MGMRPLVLCLLFGCGPQPECDGDEVPRCPAGCIPLCADGSLHVECDAAECAWVDDTELGPRDVLCTTVEDGPNEADCADPRQSPRCACE